MHPPVDGAAGVSRAPSPSAADVVRAWDPAGGVRRPQGPQDQCGVFAVFGHPDAARLTYFGLFALQHRGQESAGIAVADGRTVRWKKGMGLVSEVLSEDLVAELGGTAAIGHVRYSTTGSSLLVNAQPIVVRYRRGTLALAHNGNLTNAGRVRQRLEEAGSIFQTTVDTEVVAHLIARHQKNGLESAVVESLREVEGAFSLVFLTENRVLGARDALGIRPLELGRLGDAWVLASETCALDAVGAEWVREVEPGELVVLDAGGLRSVQALESRRRAACIFEYIYLARPDSNVDGKNVHAVRKELGRRLARDYPAEADLVIGVPDSSISAAAGYAEAAGLPYEMGLVKNRYVGRTFIQPAQKQRAAAVRLKLNALKKVVEGKRVVLVDDSIVRGTTSRHIVKLLRDAGATEVHVRISSPPYANPCFYGVDTGDPAELIANRMDVEQIRRQIGADSLAFLDPDAMVEAVGVPRERFCLACFTGDYPAPVDAGTGKYQLEGCGATVPEPVGPVGAGADKVVRARGGGA